MTVAPFAAAACEELLPEKVYLRFRGDAPGRSAAGVCPSDSGEGLSVVLSIWTFYSRGLPAPRDVGECLPGPSPNAAGSRSRSRHAAENRTGKELSQVFERMSWFPVALLNLVLWDCCTERPARHICCFLFINTLLGANLAAPIHTFSAAKLTSKEQLPYRWSSSRLAEGRSAACNLQYAAFTVHGNAGWLPLWNSHHERISYANSRLVYDPNLSNYET